MLKIIEDLFDKHGETYTSNGVEYKLLNLCEVCTTPNLQRDNTARIFYDPYVYHPIDRTFLSGVKIGDLIHLIIGNDVEDRMALRELINEIVEGTRDEPYIPAHPARYGARGSVSDDLWVSSVWYEYPDI